MRWPFANLFVDFILPQFHIRMRKQFANFDSLHFHRLLWKIDIFSETFTSHQLAMIDFGQLFFFVQIQNFFVTVCLGAVLELFRKFLYHLATAVLVIFFIDFSSSRFCVTLTLIIFNEIHQGIWHSSPWALFLMKF